MIHKLIIVNYSRHCFR